MCYYELPNLKLSTVLKMSILKILKNCVDQSYSEKIEQPKSSIKNTGSYLRNCCFNAHAQIKKKLKVRIYQKKVFICPLPCKKTLIIFKVMRSKNFLLPWKLNTRYIRYLLNFLNNGFKFFLLLMVVHKNYHCRFSLKFVGHLLKFFQSRQNN